MFFDSVDEIIDIAGKCGTSVFVLPEDVDVQIKNAIILKPEEKKVIAIEQVRQVIQMLGTKQLEDRFVIVRPADKMNDESANAFLKSLEEPKEKVHFVLITDSPSKLLPTILSRSAVFFLNREFSFKEISEDDEKIKELAKKMIAVKPEGLVALAEEIAKKKEGARSYALRVVGTAIEMLYKTYFLTRKDIFMKKLPKFLKVYGNLEKNGHIKLQIVAGLC